MYNNNIIITIINKYYLTRHSAYNHNNIHAQFYSQQRFYQSYLEPPQKRPQEAIPNPLAVKLPPFRPPSPRNFCCPPGGEDYGFFLVLHNIILLNYCHLPSSDGSTCFDNLDLIHGGRILLPTAINPPGKSIKQSIGPFEPYSRMIFFKQI